MLRLHVSRLIKVLVTHNIRKHQFRGMVTGNCLTYRAICIALPRDKMLDLSKFKGYAYDTLLLAQLVRFVCYGIENFAVKSFTKTSASGSLTISLLLTTQEDFVDSVDQDQIAHSVHIFFPDLTKLFLYLEMDMWF